MFEKIKRLRAARPLRFHHFDHRRNHFAGLFDHDGVANPNVFAFDFVFVVKRCAADAASADHNRLERRDRRKDSGSSDLNQDVVKLVSTCSAAYL